MTPLSLRQQCHTIVSGDRPRTAAEDFAEMAAWCGANAVSHDTYGDGALIDGFQQKIAHLLGFEAGLFTISGTITQVTVLRLACMARGSRNVAMHPSAHILKHELANYQMLDHFTALPVGDPMRPWTVDDLRPWPDRLGAILYELPMREIGGQLPTWEQLAALKAHCASHAIHLHMDGARLWEAGAGFGRTLAQIAAGFDSVYVSFYKGIGGLGGAMLLGSQAMIDQTRAWIQRLGGNVYRRSPYVVAAAMRFDTRLAAMPAYFRRTEWLYRRLLLHPRLQANPAAPQSNMLHLHLPMSKERAVAMRDRIATEHGVWLFGGARHAALPGHSYVEWYVGESLLAMPDAQIDQVLEWLSASL